MHSNPSVEKATQQDHDATEDTPLRDAMLQAKDHGALVARTPSKQHNVVIGHGSEEVDPGYYTDSDITEDEKGEKLSHAPTGFFDRMVPPGGTGAAVASLISSVVTPSMLSLPLAFAEGGSAFCVWMIIGCIVMTVFSTRFLCIASTESGMKSYEGIARHYYGYNCRTLTRVIMFGYNLGSSVVYLRFIADSIAPVLDLDFVPSALRDQGGVYIMLLVWVFVTPLTFDAKISSMRYKSFFSNFLTLTIIGIIVYRYYYPLPYMLRTEKHTHPPDTVDYGWLMPQFFVAPMIVFSYELQSNLVSVYAELQDQSMHTILEALGWTMLAATGFYTAIGIYGAGTFGDRVLGNILNNYDPQKDLLISYALTACCVSAGVCFVFVLFPCRHALLGAHDHSQAMLMKFGGGISLLACLLAVFVPNVSAAISILGALCSSTLSMTLPALFLFKAKQEGSMMVTRADVIAATVLLPIGLIFGIFGTIMSAAVLLVK